MSSLRTPPSLLTSRPPRIEEVAGGLAAVALAGVFLFGAGPLLLAGAPAITPGDESGEDETEDEQTDPVEESIVEARFVRLEGVLDDRRLPDKIVRRSRREVPEPSPQTDSRAFNPRHREQHEFRTDAGVRTAFEDLMNAAGEAQRHDREFQRQQAGHADGVPDGDAQEGDAWSVWATQLYAHFRRSWSPPAMTEAQRQSLSVRVNLQISAGLMLTAGNLAGSSGNADFDHSVQQCIQAVRSSGASLPQPPPEIVDIAHTRPIALRFYGRHARGAAVPSSPSTPTTPSPGPTSPAEPTPANPATPPATPPTGGGGEAPAPAPAPTPAPAPAPTPAPAPSGGGEGGE